MKTYVVLIRGVNVGGKSKISMATLRQQLEAAGMHDVRTYINSGNVLLRSELDAPKLSAVIDKLIADNFSLQSVSNKTLVLTVEQLQRIIAQKPPGFGEQPDKYYSDIIFMMGITAKEAMQVFSPREGVDTVWQGEGVVYSQRLGAERTKSRLGKIVGTPLYRFMTIRSWGTATKLLALLEEAGDA